MSSIASIIKTKLQLPDSSKDLAKLRWRFRLPDSQFSINSLPCEIQFIHYNNAEETSSLLGILYLFTDYIAFRGDEEGTQFCMPYTIIRKVSKVKSDDFEQLLSVSTSNGYEFRISLQVSESTALRFCGLLKEELISHKVNMHKASEFTKQFFSEQLISPNVAEGNQSYGFGCKYGYPTDPRASRERAKLRMWKEYFLLYGTSLSLIRVSLFSKLVRIELPNKLRGEIWELTSGSLYLRLQNENEYEHILHAHSGQTSFSLEEIEKDLGRSLPEYPAYQNDEGIDALRNVLVAFSWKNQDVGYCQAMNIVAAALLIHCNEAQAFYLMHKICEDYIPGYYSKTMYGTLIDQQVYETLVQRLMPNLHAHFVNKDIQLSIISLPWFLSLFFCTMPLPYAFRLMDFFFLEGPRVLFQIGMAVLYDNESEILKATEETMLISLLKKYFSSLSDRVYKDATDKRVAAITKFQLLLVTAFKKFGNITHPMIESERKRHFNKVINSIESFAKRTQIRSIQNYGSLTRDDLSNIYDRYHEILSTKHEFELGTSVDTKLEFDEFCVFMGGVTDWSKNLDATAINGSSSFLRHLFLRFDRSRVGSLSLQDLVSGIAELKVRDVMRNISFIFELYDSDSDGFMDKSDVLKVSEAILWITRYMGDECLSAVSEFIQRCFHFADEAGPEHQEEEKLVDVDESLPSGGLASERNVSANSDIRVSLPTFRMVILSNVLLEQLFSGGLADSVVLPPVEEKTSTVGGLRGLLDSLVLDTNRWSETFRGHKHAAAIPSSDNATSTGQKLYMTSDDTSNFEKVKSHTSDIDEDVGEPVEDDKDLLQFDPYKKTEA
ncbi:Rab GAP [Schizosaccharomyces osmophilus]|uniref:Rab GAP n=1 Tax=Schizosaccharomyces osmophilus TaxID=2545709 RepID=A0AAF0ATZ4_9SCHI|nr:Rab GAP [Schizosaccharomyces osmophilus]WBW70878.1 Rab GAP [Schizosaccharomyces osmophilus]